MTEPAVNSETVPNDAHLTLILRHLARSSRTHAPLLNTNAEFMLILFFVSKGIEERHMCQPQSPELKLTRKRPK